MGFPFGADEDASFIIAWLELNHFDGIKIFHSLIDSIDQKYDGVVKINNLDKRIDFKNYTILMKGPGLIDYLQSLLNKRKNISFNILNCPDGILFLPLLYKISKRNNYLELTFKNSADKTHKYKIEDQEIFYDSEIESNLLFRNEVKIIMNNDKEMFENSSIKKIITNKVIQDNLAKSIDARTDIWEDISKIANKTFVPESIESRDKGAGGGDAND